MNSTNLLTENLADLTSAVEGIANNHLIDDGLVVVLMFTEKANGDLASLSMIVHRDGVSIHPGFEVVDVVTGAGDSLSMAAEMVAMRARDIAGGRVERVYTDEGAAHRAADAYARSGFTVSFVVGDTRDGVDVFVFDLFTK